MTMLEEINRLTVDHVSNLACCYHKDFIDNLRKENYHGTALNVGNTIVEPTKKYGKFRDKKKEDYILLDIHRPENFNDENRLRNILTFAELCSKWYEIPILMLEFRRTMAIISEKEIPLGSVKTIPLVGYKKFLELQYHSKFMISDSGTAQEEPALLDTPVVVPRNYTERPQSITNKCSIHVSMDSDINTFFKSPFAIDRMFDRFKDKCINWLGSGNTSYEILYGIKEYMNVT
jgi:UDP-N-acetylglucosamine 2-epimerase